MMSEPMTTISVPVSMVEAIKGMVGDKMKSLTMAEVEDFSAVMTIRMDAVIKASAAWNGIVSGLTQIDCESQERMQELRAWALLYLSEADGYLPGMIVTALRGIRGEIDRFHERAERTLKDSTSKAS